ncbi:MAG: murein biosynthesis integral membrane protein MurJ [Clostridiales bacterium]|nr:murein biosynthesis integral membrane protein MurJ [Clostridiales bacterium]
MSESHGENKTIGKKVLSGALIIIAVSVLAKIMSYVTEAVNAYYMGTGSTADAFSMVTSIQNMIYPMLSIGISKVFLPAYKRHMTLGEDEQANRLANRMITMLLIITGCVAALLMIFSRQVVSVVASGFDEETASLCADLVTISAPMYLFIIVASTYSSMLHCHNRFFGSQIREVVSHIPPVVCAILLYKRLGAEMGVRAMAVSLIIGAMCRLLIELPFVNWNYRYKPDVSFRDDEFRHVLRKLPAAMVTAGITQINTLVDSMMASGLGKGAVSSLKYATRLTHVLSGLISAAVSTALYPQMVELITLNKRRELSKIVTKIINIFCILIIPVSIAGFLFRVPLISVAFERGKFDSASTEATAGIFCYYCIGLLFGAISSLLNNIFYGHGDTRTPMFISIGTVSLNVGLNFLLSSLMGIGGLALATSIATITAATVKLILARKYIDIPWRSEAFTVGKIIAASIVSIAPAYYISRLIANKYLHLITAAAIGIALYLVMVKLLRIETLKDVVRLATGKLKKLRRKCKNNG